MKFGGFLHLNIRCSPEDIAAIEKFYGDARLEDRLPSQFQVRRHLALRRRRPGHSRQRAPQGWIVKDKHSGSVDHIAFKASGAAEFRKRLKRLGIDFEEQNIENAGYQLFVYDPVGTKLEFNFLKEHVADAVPLGTTADANLR
jgi:hypothetical protein